MDKKRVVQKIIAALQAELDRYVEAAKAAQDGAADEQSRAENKYDTRGLEAAYLAHGQSRQIIETQTSLSQYSALTVETLECDAPIAVGALVTVSTQGERTIYFVGPSAGGMEVTCEGHEITVVTPQSPLGRALLDKRPMNRIIIGSAEHEILSVV